MALNLKRLLQTVFLFLFLTSSTSLADKSNDPLAKYSTQKIAKNTWAIFGPLETPNKANQGFMNNPVFVITDQSVVVIDPGSSVHIGHSLIKRIKLITDKPITHIFISHVHGDHWLAVDAFHQTYPNIKVYAHPMMIQEAQEGEGESWVSLMSNLTEGATKGTKVVIPALALKDQDIIQVDNIRIKTHLSDLSHTKTDAMFQIIEHKVLITGDNSFNGRMPRMDDGSFVGNINAIQNALTFDIEHVIPGHGALGGKEVLNAYKELLSIIYEEVKTLLDDDLESFEMKPIIVKKLAAFTHWENFNDTIGKLISLAVLEAENE